MGRRAGGAGPAALVKHHVNFDDIRPVFSGLVGGAIAVWLSNRLSRWMPSALDGKSAQALVDENRSAIRFANFASLFGILGVLVLYQLGGFAHNDWRPLALGLGFAFAAPLLVLPIVALATRTNIRHCMVAYAISQGMPVAVIYGLLVLGLPLFFAGLLYLL